MLIDRTEKDNIVNAIYESSNIMASSFNYDNNELSVIFKSGMEYIYEGLDVKDYLRFELADSQGAIFNKYIKPYPFRKGKKVDLNVIKNKITEIKQGEIADLSMKMSEIAEEIHINFKETGVLDEQLIKDFHNINEIRKTKMNLND